MATTTEIEEDQEDREDREDREDQEYQEDREEKSVYGYSPEQETELKGFARRFHVDVKGLAKKYIKQFFSDKMLHCGGKIPHSLLFAEWRISLVLNYDIVHGVERAYNYLDLDHMTSPQTKTGKADNCEVTKDIKLVNETLNLLSRSCIPQQFAGGMMLLYLEFVEGINIGTHP